MANIVLLMLGSNVDSEKNMALAQENISRIFTIVSESKIIETKAVGWQYENSTFLNKALKIVSEFELHDTKKILKNIEASQGRTALSKEEGKIPIDIDILFWNNLLIHSDYDTREYVRICINEIN